jgi:hypothetical protein
VASPDRRRAGDPADAAARPWVEPIERSEDMLSLYRAVMDSNVNPLHVLPPAQRFQVMAYLGTMWTTIFCGAAGAWLWYGELVTLHVLVAAGFLVTGLTFANAAPTETYRDRPLRRVA